MFLEELMSILEGKETEVIAASWRSSFSLCCWLLLKSSFDREECKFLSVKKAKLGRMRSQGVPRSLKGYQKILYSFFSYITSHAWSSHSVKYTFLPSQHFPQEIWSTYGSYPRGLVPDTIVGQRALLLNEKVQVLVGGKVPTNVCVFPPSSAGGHLQLAWLICFAELYLICYVCR